MRKRLVKILIWWLMLWGIIFLFAFSFPISRLRSLRTAGVGTAAIITGKTDHQGVRYVFSVNNKYYGGISRTGVANIPREETINVGDSAFVTYLPDDPSVNALGDIGLLLDHEVRSSIALAGFCLIAVLFIFLWNHFFPRRSFLGISLAPLNRLLFGD